MKFTQPVNAWILLTVGGVNVLILNAFSSYFGSLAVNSWYTSVLAFALVGLAAMIFPFRRPDIHKSSPLVKWNVGKLPIVSVLGFIGLVWNIVMFYFYMVTPAYGMGVFAPSAEFIVVVFVACYIYYFIRQQYLKRKGIELHLAFTEIPLA